MAMSGLRPVVAIYSTFLNRAWDQVLYDVALHRLPVVFCLDRAGITGPDGPSHHGVHDMALLARVPGMRVLAPSSAQELHTMLHDAMSLADEGPVAIRYPRGQAPQVGEHDVGEGLRARCVRAGNDVALLSIGKMLAATVKAADRLADRGCRSRACGTSRSCAPLDQEMLAAAAACRRVVTIEDGVRDGGIGMTIADRIHAIDESTPVTVLGLPTVFIPHHHQSDQLLAQFGLDPDGIAAAAATNR